MNITVNGRARKVDVEPEMPLLWVLRDELGLTGTKYGCGIAVCGACTVHVNGEPVRACSVPVSSVQGKRITTIEGLSRNGTHPVQRAWLQHGVPQCGYCQSGQIMAAAALLAKKPNPSETDVNEGIANICRCGTYARIKDAIQTASKLARSANAKA
jgi:isoquinoline 1-oxidoreductase alpha subunit